MTSLRPLNNGVWNTLRFTSGQVLTKHLLLPILLHLVANSKTAFSRVHGGPTEFFKRTYAMVPEPRLYQHANLCSALPPTRGGRKHVTNTMQPLFSSFHCN